MDAERHDRRSDAEFAARNVEQKCFEAETLLDLLFVEGGELSVTHSVAGEPRVRAIIGDPDGWAEYETPAGVAKSVGPHGAAYVAEQQFKMQEGKPVYMWRLDPRAHQLDLDIVTDKGVVYSSDDLPFGTDPLEDLDMRWSSFTRCLQGMSGYLGKDYDSEVGRFPGDHYPFRHQALRDYPVPPWA